MNGITHYETFLVAGILLNLTPGNDTLYILSKSLAQGRRAGVISALGIGTGCMGHTVLASLGISLIIARSLLVFTLVKYLGAAYLIYLGIRMLLDKSALDPGTALGKKRVGDGQIFREAMLTNLLNPKVALFFIAFLPQFVDPGYHKTFLPFLLLGATFVLTGTVWCLLLGIFASKVFEKVKGHPKAGKWINRASGIMLLGLGVKVAFTQR